MPKDGENPVAVLNTEHVWELLARAGGQEQPHWEQVRGLRQGKAGKGIPGTSAPALHRRAVLNISSYSSSVSQEPFL